MSIITRDSATCAQSKPFIIVSAPPLTHGVAA
jgi:hypothetical protein